MTFLNLYILSSKGKPVLCKDVLKWAHWFANDPSRFPYKTSIGSVRVSTIFLGINHEHRLGHPPALWETMVFGGKLDQEQARCSGSAEQAQAMHAEMVRRVMDTKTGHKKPPTRKVKHDDKNT